MSSTAENAQKVYHKVFQDNVPYFKPVGYQSLAYCVCLRFVKDINIDRKDKYKELFVQAYWFIHTLTKEQSFLTKRTASSRHWANRSLYSFLRTRN